MVGKMSCTVTGLIRGGRDTEIKGLARLCHPQISNKNTRGHTVVKLSTKFI